jgi:uncharacterized delta-60 repeat protein
VYVHAVQADGKILVGGLFGVIGGKVRRNFARLNSSGTTDDTFQVGTGTNESVNAIAIQPDGKIIIGGFFTTYNKVPRSYIARLNVDGSLDTSFNADLNNVVYEIVVQPDGNVLVGGEFTSVNGTIVNNIVRLNSDGSLDAAFNLLNGEVGNPVRAIAIQSDGKIMVGGETLGGGSRRSFLRLNSNGSTDSSFNIGAGFNGKVNEIRIQQDGKYLAGGSFNGFNGATAPNNVARINMDGTLDTGFVSGLAAFDTVNKIAVQTDGKFFLVGNFTSFGSVITRGIVRVNTTGTLDPSFNTGGGVDITNPISSVDVLADGKVLLSGFFGSYANAIHSGIVKINLDGAPDGSFAPRLGNVGMITDMVVDAGDRIMVVGDFSFINGVPREKIARLLPNGFIDPSFDPEIGVDGDINSVFAQSNQKILIAGNFTSFNGMARDNIARLNFNGSLDTTFDSGLMDEFGFVDDIAETSNGKIVVGGSFGSINGTARNFLAQLNSNGSVDPDFSHPIVDGRVRTILPQSNGKLYVGGAVFTIGPNTSFMKGLVRLNANGTLDDTFVIGTGVDGTVFTLGQQADGKLILGGGFLSYNGTNRRSIARINGNGSLDTSFNPGGGALGQVNELAVDFRGRIFAGGNFQIFDGIPVGNLVRLRSNGSFDQRFPVGSGSNSRVTAIAIQAFSSILVGCGSEFDGTARGAMARVFNISTAAPFDFDGDGKSDISVFRPSDRIWYLNRSTAGFSATQFGLSSDKVTPADFDGDGKTDIAVFRDGVWYWINTSNGGFNAVHFGIAGDIPLPADYTGDGRSELAIFRGGVWWTLNLTNNQAQSVQFGISSDKPFPADFDGDGKTDMAIYRDGVWWWLRSSDGQPRSVQFGLASDKPVVADYDGDGKADQAVFRDGIWYILQSQSGFKAFQWGLATDIPAPADFDGDGMADATVYRDGVWWQLSSQSGIQSAQFGLAGDKPTPAAFLGL